MQRRQVIYKIMLVCALAGSVLAALKCILVGYCQDEEYQIVMAYRRTMGDTLFGTMWEPHQMSAFLNTVLIRIWILLTGSTTGILLFLRFCGTMIQFAIGLFLYKILKLRFEKPIALLLSILYWNTSVGLFASPEYSNMEFWFLSLLLLFTACFQRYGFDSREGKICLVPIAAFKYATWDYASLSAPSPRLCPAIPHMP